MPESIVTMKNVTFTYDERTVLNDIDFSIPPGAFMGLIGPNGGGKTTLIKLILGLLRSETGEIHLFGQPLSEFKAWNKIGFVAQKSNAFNAGFPATVDEVVSMGLTAKIGYGKWMTKHHKKQVLEALEQVGMRAYAHENIGNLSGGQQQRVFIARSLVNDPSFLILDEPTVGVDTQNVQRFYELLNYLHAERHLTLLFVTHDTGAITKYATDIACLNKDLHFHDKPEAFLSLSNEELSTIYGHHVDIVTHDH